ncbi:MAG: hypothetical protein HC834_08570 [Rhodospirillales bacterium]|nr:hypothetical protein [Rhodospirillales bacterium]
MVALGVIGGGAYFTRDQWLPQVEENLGGALPDVAGLLGTKQDDAVPPTTAPDAQTSVATPAPQEAGTEDGVAPAEEPATGVETATTDTAGESASTQAGSATEDEAEVAPQSLANQVESLSSRLQGLEQSIDDLKQSTEALSAATNTKELNATVALLADRITQLERKTSDVAELQKEFGELNAKAVALRQGYAGLNAAVLATDQLARAVDDGLVYTRQLASVESLAGDDLDVAAAVEILKPHASTGIPTFAELRAQFPALADAVARAAPTTGGDQWYHQALDEVLSLVTIRRSGSAAARAGGIDAILTEAETALAGGDLGAAVERLDRLEGMAAAPAEEWLKAARLRLAATEAVARLHEQAATRLAQVRG